MKLNMKESLKKLQLKTRLEIAKTKIAKKIYKKLGLKGFSRSEFIFIGDTPYFIEINSIPGITKESIFPKQAKNYGISLKNLCTEIILRDAQ